jgi:prepilin-type N-terminal cleavage/methylation domain-containing protein
MKKGLTIIEVIVAVGISAILFSGILILLNFISNYQVRQEDTWKAHKILENMHSIYLNDPTYYEIGNNNMYFDENLEETNFDYAYFIVSYVLLKDDNDIYEMSVLNVETKYKELKLSIDFGKWVKS